MTKKILTIAAHPDDEYIDMQLMSMRNVLLSTFSSFAHLAGLLTKMMGVMLLTR